MDPMKHLASFLNGFTSPSALVCSIEGDPPTEGGGTPATQPPPAPAQPASSPQFTPEQMAWIREETTRATNAAAAAARRAEQERLGRRGGEQPQPNRTDTTPAAPPSAPDAMTVVSRLRAFDRAAGRYGLTDSARDILEQDFNAANPSDPAAWVQQRAEAFGWKASGATNAQPSIPAPGPAPGVTPAAPPTPPPAMPNGAPPARVITDDTPFYLMSRDEQAALINRIGPFEFKKLAFRQLAASGQRFSLRPNR